jgi:2-dehydro-3-deoxygalactonokinase
MHLPDAETREASFEAALQDTCGDWLAVSATPVLACGMVGSAQGWQEAVYLPTPAALSDLGLGLVRINRGAGVPVHVVPGLLQGGVLPNVMRGEETQVLGVLCAASHTGAHLIGLPGTHSKWVRAEGGTLLAFDTFMTGEVYAALRQHTILGRTMDPGADPDTDAFLKGVAVAWSADGPLGLLSHVFSSRTLGLTGVLPATAQADYLSGVLIGHELAGLQHRGVGAWPVTLCGDPALCHRYALALQTCGWAAPTLALDATTRGLWQVATAAGLVAAVHPV